MKKLVTVLTAAVMLFSSFAFATDSDKVNARVRSAFLNDFGSVTAVSWEKTSDFYFAAFIFTSAGALRSPADQGRLQARGGLGRTIAGASA